MGQMENENDAENALRARGKRDGAARGTWVIDGNTSEKTARALLKGIDECDPKIMDSLPVLQLGEWADDPSFEDICHDEGFDDLDDDEIDELFQHYSDGWYEGLHDEVRASAARVLGLTGGE